MNNDSNNLYLHLDGDSFFVACELTTHPDLRGKPVIVGGDRGIAVAMSSEAKKLGVTRGMPVFRIKKLFPEVVILNHHFELYRDISNRMHEILATYATKIEEYSIDECFALVEPYEIGYFGNEKKFLQELKKEIESKLGVTYSLGLARTKALSKLASKLEKPAGLVMLLEKGDEVRALKATSIEDIWGIGRKTVPKLKALGMQTAYDFVNYSAEKIGQQFSRPLVVLQKELSGISIMKVESDTDPRDQKSIQSTSTFHPASTDPKVIWREIAENAERACTHSRVICLITSKVAFFVKTSEFKYHFDEVKLEEFTSDPGIVLNALEPKLLKLLPRGKRIRSTGVILHNLIREETAPHDLFGKQEKAFKKRSIEETADKLRQKFGSDAIKRAVSLKQRGKEQS
ncbi:MAG: DNA polymerase IV [bacterium]|nr:DNA polymerase IV [bacterium]